MKRLLAVVLAALVAVPAGAAGSPVVERSFTINVEAFPVAPAPGQQQTELSVRPAGTRAAVANAPATAYARGAVVDSGAIELFTGPPPEESVAECDTGSPNVPDEAAADPGGSRLRALCTNRPSGRASASGSSAGDDDTAAGSFSSAVHADGGDEAAVGEAQAEMHDGAFGPFAFSSARYEARASAGGVPGRASAHGVVTVSGASVAGIPVRVGPGGVTVDETEVPVELAPAAAAAVNDALTQGGFSTVRLVQPETTVAEDGSRATVRGGGLFVELADPDPKSRRFLRMTFVGGRIEVSVGPVLGEPDAAPPAAVDPPSSPPRSDAPPAGDAPSAAAPSPPVAAPGDTTVETTAEDSVVLASSVHRLPGWWDGWVWLVAAATLLAGAVAAWRRRALATWDALADRFLRG